MKRFIDAKRSPRLLLSCFALLVAGPVTAQTLRDTTILIDKRVKVGKIAFSPDGKTLAYTNPRKNQPLVVLCDVKTGKETGSFQLSQTTTGKLLAFSPDGKFLVTTVSSGEVGKRGKYGIVRVEVWDVKQQKQDLVFDLEEGDGDWSDVLFTSDSKTLIFSSALDGSVALYDARKGKRTDVLKGKDTRPRFLALSADDKWLVTGQEKKVVTLWDVAKRKEVLSIDAHLGDLRGVAISPKGDHILSTDGRGAVYLWDAKTGKLVKRHLYKEGIRPYQYLAFGKDAKTVIAAGAARMPGILVWDPATDALSGGAAVGPEWPASVVNALSPDGTLLATLLQHKPQTRVRGQRGRDDGPPLPTLLESEGIRFWDLPSADDVNKAAKGKQQPDKK
jgi:WD40 repeat protein